MDKSKLHGTGVALATPFNGDFSIDYGALRRVINHVAEGGADYLAILGTTGEAPTIAADEKRKITEFVIENNKRNLPIVYGLGEITPNGSKTRSMLSRIIQ